MLRTKAGDQLEITQLLHPLRQVAITMALKEAKEGVVAEEVVAEAEVRLQGTTVIAVTQDGDLCLQVTRDTELIPT